MTPEEKAVLARRLRPQAIDNTSVYRYHRTMNNNWFSFSTPDLQVFLQMAVAQGHSDTQAAIEAELLHREARA